MDNTTEGKNVQKKQKEEGRNARRCWLPGMVPGYRDQPQTKHVMYVPVLSPRSASSLYHGNQIAWHKFRLCTVMRSRNSHGEIGRIERSANFVTIKIELRHITREKMYQDVRNRILKRIATSPVS